MKNTFDIKRFIALLLVICSLISMGLEVSATTLTQYEIAAAKKVEYISDYDFFYYEEEDAYVILFSFLDVDENRISCPCTVEARLVNSEGTEVYSTKKRLSMVDNFNTWTWDSPLYQSYNGIYGSISISPDEILKSKSGTGTMYLRVYLDEYWEFDEIDIEIDELPMIESSIKLPSLPQTIRYRSNSAVKITNIRYQLEKHNYDDQLTLKIFITGEMTLGSSNTAKTSLIGWRLIDDEGYIIDSGNWYTDDLTIGEKFRDKEFSIFNVNPGVYSLELRNVN